MRDASEHPYLAVLKGQFADGRIHRREFLRAATLLGLSASAAYGFIGKVTGESLLRPAKADMPKGGVLRIGMKVLDRFEIRKIARPFLQELSDKFNETINLGFFNGEAVLTIDKIDSTERLRMDAGIGGGEPAYCTSLGKAILAFLSDRKLEQYLQATELISFTPNTLISKDKLKEELLQIRENVYAIDDEELSIGLRCVGAPLFNHNGQVHYAISISGPSIRMGSKKVGEMQRELKKICQKLSRIMGNYHF